ncbi:MAG: hypothetical protein M3Y74_19580 [Chloroflexota bacterium]|nr:hypothetical protein [Chloroflexota bacterium]
MTQPASRLRPQTAITLVLLGVEFLLGMGVNLYVRIPSHHPGSSADNPGNSYFADVVQSVVWAVAHETPALVLHVLVGLALFVSAVVLLVRAIWTRCRAWIIVAAVGLLGIIAAGFNGGSFLTFDSAAISSLIMSIAFAVAAASYMSGLSLARAAEAGTHEVPAESARRTTPTN